MCVCVCSRKPFIHSEDSNLKTKLIHRGRLNRESVKETEGGPHGGGPTAPWALDCLLINLSACNLASAGFSVICSPKHPNWCNSPLLLGSLWGKVWESARHLTALRSASPPYTLAGQCRPPATNWGCRASGYLKIWEKVLFCSWRRDKERGYPSASRWPMPRSNLDEERLYPGGGFEGSRLQDHCSPTLN